LTSVVLPEPVLPMMAVVCPGLALKEISRQYGLLGAGVAELDVVEFDQAVRIRQFGRHVRVGDLGLRVEDLLDPPGGDCRSRNHDEHERGHHHGHENLHDVLEEGRQIADRHATRIDAQPAEPDDGHGREVHDPEQERDHRREETIDPQRGVGEVAVGDVVARLVVIGAHERADDADAAQRLAHDLLDAVGPLLHGLEERHRSRGDHAHDDGHEGHDDDEQARERNVLADRHDDAADQHDRGHEHDIEDHDQDHLNLLDVVRVARDQ
jgi:hypothetical protein